MDGLLQRGSSSLECFSPPVANDSLRAGALEVTLNGQLQPSNFSGAAGAVGNGPSPNRGTNHSIFELSFPASAGGFGVQLHDPGPRFECGVLETEPARVVGVAPEGGGEGAVLWPTVSEWG